TTFYAPNTLLDDKGRRILWGWVRIKGDGWNGMLTLPRVLTLRPDGRLAMAAAPELNGLRTEPRRAADISVQPGRAHAVTEIDGNCLEGAAEFEPGTATGLGLQIRSSSDGKAATRVWFDRGRKQLSAGPARGAFDLLKDEQTVRLQVFVDRCVL